MKKLILLCGIILITAITYKEIATEEVKVVETKIKVETADLKDHICSEEFFNTEECIFVHGEKRYTCDASCKL